MDTIIVLNTNEIPEMDGYWSSYYYNNIYTSTSECFPFSNDMQQVTVVVPCHTYNDYINHVQWSFFDNITEADSCVEYDFWAISPSYDTLYYRIMDSNNVMVIHPRADREWRGVAWPVDELIIPEAVEHDGTTYTVTSISNMVFAYDTAITSLSLPHTLTSVGSGAFAFCKQLDSVYYDANITSYYWSRADIFHMDTNITSITIGNHAKAIPFGMFGDNGGASHNLSSLILGDSLVKIGDYAFSGMNRIDTLRIPNSVITIGNGAFKGAYSNYDNRTDRLKAVIIGSGVDTIGTTAFALHYNVDSIAVLNENSRFDSRGGCNAIVETATNRLILGCQTTEIPNNVTAIGPYAFYGCQHLTSLTIPDSVSFIDEYAFSDCYGLNIIDLSSSTPPEVYWSSFDYSIRQNIPVIVPCGSILTYMSSNWGQIFSTIVERNGCTPSVWYDFWTVSPSGDTLYYKIKDSANVAVVHPLENNYNTERSYWAGFTQPSGTLIIPDRVENEGVNYRVSAVWDETFKGNSAISSITIPAHIDSLGQHAFAQCSNLDTIHYNADSCIYLNGYSAFEEDNISTLYIGQNVRWMRESLFSFLSNQSDSITLYFNADSAVVNNSYSYYYSSSPFSGLPITSLYIGNNVKSIPNKLFYGCDRITSITLPDSLKYIGTSAFEGCNSIATLTIPESVEHIGSYAFHNCNRLTSLNYNARNCNTDNSMDIFTFDTTLVTIDTVFFFDSLYDDGRDLWYYCYEQYDYDEQYGYSYDVGEHSYDMGERCVYHEYENDNFYSRWFYFDEYPTIVYMDNNYYISQYCEDEDCQYISYDTIYFYDEYYDDYRGLSYCYYYDETTGEWRQLFHDEYGDYGEYGWFYEEYERHYLNVDYFVNRQTDNTPWSNVSTLNIGSQVETIPSGIFSGLIALHSVEIPESVRTIRNYSFSGSGLTSIAIPNTVQHLGNGVFENCASLATATLPNHLDTIPDYIFTSCESLTDYIFSDSTVYIGESSFRNCTSLTSVVVPDSVTTIGDEAFSGCTGLTLATIGRNVANIGSSAFANCTNLDTVNYNALNCSSRDWYYNPYDYLDVFHNSGVSILNIGESVHTIPNCIFRGCSNIDRITIPDSVSSIGSYSFYGCTGVSTLSIGKRVSIIGLSAFYECSGIDTIFLHPNVPPSIESNSFNGVGYYVPVYVPCHTLSTYTASTNWNSHFGNILEENCDYPDLQVTGIVLPDSIVSCSDLQVLATITNEGTYRARTNGWYDELYISHLPTFDSSAIRLARMRHNNASNMLQPDSSYTVTFLGQIPHLWIGETYFYIATAVGFDETELDTTNNVTTSVMRTVLLPDIVHPDIVVWDTACVQYTWNGHTYDTSGLYTYVHEYDDSPCHNTDTLHLKIWPTYNIHQYVSIADTTSYSFCGHEYSQTGVYSEEMLSIHGCDSVQTLHLQVLPIRRPIVTASVCQGTPYNGSRARFNLSGSETADTIGLLVLRDTIRSSHGLDSVIFGVDLTVLPSNLSAATGMMPAADSVIEHGDVALSWNAVEGATGYWVYLWNSTQAMPAYPSYTTNNTFWNTPMCENQQTYFWKVEAYNPCDTVASTTHSFSIDILPTITTLPVVQATVCQGLPYDGGRERFQIPASVTTDTLGLMELRDTALTSMGYEVTIYGVNLTVLPSNLPAATGMMPAADSVITHGGVALRWNAVEGADGYRVFLWDSESTMPTMPTHTTSNTYWNVPTYENRHTYSWKVEAYNPCDTTAGTIQHFLIYKEPSMTLSSHALAFGEVEYNASAHQSLTISGRDLTDSIRLAVRGTDSAMFALSTPTLDRFGGSVTVAFSPTAMQRGFEAYLTVTGGTTRDTVALSGLMANYYLFTVSVADSILPANIPVTISGTLENAAQEAQANVAVDVYVKIMGQTYLYTDTTDAAGHFGATYNPVPSECGYYEVGACLHGSPSRRTMAEFNIPGISLATYLPTWEVTEHDTLVGVLSVRNRCNVTLHHIVVAVDSLPAGMSITFDTLTLPPFGSGDLRFTLGGNIVTDGSQYERARFTASCLEGPLGKMETRYYCHRHVSDLQIAFDTINCAIVPGTQKVVDVALYNNTDSTFSNVSLQTPAGFAGMRVLNLDSSYTIAPHDSLFVPLLVMFPLGTPLAPVTGSILVTADNALPQQVPFVIDVVSNAKGSLRVMVANEYTYAYGTYVSDAQVRVVGYYNQQTYADVVTDSTGEVTIDSLPEGYYRLYVSATDNNSVARIIQITAGRVNLELVELEYQAVSYSWVVYPKDVEDSWGVTLNTTYKTNVPKPVVVLSLPEFTVRSDGEFSTFNIVVTNHGLVDAYDATLTVPTSNVYEFVPLFDRIDTLHALTSVTIPCSVRNKVIYDTIETIIHTRDVRIDTIYTIDTHTVTVTRYVDTIIYVPVNHWVQDTIFDTVMVYDTMMVTIPRRVVDTVVDSIVDRIVYYDTTLHDTLFVITDEIEPLYGSCEIFPFRLMAHWKCSAGGKWVYAGATLEKMDCDLPKDSALAMVGGVGDLTGGTFMDGPGGPRDSTSTATGPGGTGGPGGSTIHWPQIPPLFTPDWDCMPCWFKASMGAADCLGNVALAVGTAGWGNRIRGTQQLARAASIDAGNYLSLNLAWQNAVRSGNVVAMSQAGQRLGEGTLQSAARSLNQAAYYSRLTEEVDLFSNATTVGGISGAVLEQDYNSAALQGLVALIGIVNPYAGAIGSCVLDAMDVIDYCRNGASVEIPWGYSHNISVDTNVYELNLRLSKRYQDTLQSIRYRIVNDTQAVFIAHPEVLQSIVGYLVSTDSATLQQIRRCYDTTIITIDTSTLEHYVDRWNRTVTYVKRGWMFPSEVPEGLSIDYFYLDTNTTGELVRMELTAMREDYWSIEEMFAATIDSLIHYPQKTSVCAGVSLQFRQEVAMTREAFEGQLIINNPHDSNALQDLSLSFTVSDTLGNDCSDKFDIRVIGYEGISEAGTLAAHSTGIATVRFVPLMSAAPTSEVPYLFGGTIEYIDPFTHATMADALVPARLTVHPSPHLQLDYFVPHDIIADDPLTTPVIEPSVPATIGLRLLNDGIGTAKNVRVSSLSPKIVENQQGLVVDFTMLGTMLDGSENSQPLSDIALGTVASSETHTMEYLLKSSLLGTITVDEVNVIHNSSINDRDMSLVSARAHSLVKTVMEYRPGSDTIHDFLTNDGGLNRPDTIYFSSGRSARVVGADTALFNHYVETMDTVVLPDSTIEVTRLVDTVVRLTVYPDTIGWQYASTEDPGEGKYDIVTCIRDDSVSIPLDNIWLTFVDLVAGLDPEYNNRLHIVDTLSAVRPTSYNVTFRLKEDMLKVKKILDIPMRAIGSTLDSFRVRFNQPIIDTSFTYADMSLKCNNGVELMDSTVTVSRVDDTTYSVHIASKTNAFGLYVLKVMADSIRNADGHFGAGGREAHWVHANCITVKDSTAVTACDRYTWRDTLLTSSGIYTDTLSQMAGCDSILLLNLTIHNSDSIILVDTACDSYTWHDSIYTASSINSITSINSQDCDSTVTLHLTINYSTASIDTVTACDSYTWHDSIYSTSSINSITSINSQGCDSTVTLHLTINYSTTSTETVTACDSYTWHDSIYTASSIDSITSINSQGCDSTVTLLLTINYSTHDTIVDSAAGSYTWQGNTYNESGEYLFEGQTEAGCDSIIVLQLTITEVGIGTADNLGHITLSPNPTTGKITISPSEVYKVEVYDQSGRIVAIFHDSNVINIHHLPTGIYTLRITLHNGNAIKRVIKQ